MYWFFGIIIYIELCCGNQYRVAGEIFYVKCGIWRGGVLASNLFSFYIDYIIAELVKIFVGCILYADGIILMSCSCSENDYQVNVNDYTKKSVH